MLEIRTVELLFDVLALGGDNTDGEPVDLLAHGLQCAALLAEGAPEDIELQVAGLVHDIGTVLAPSEAATHAFSGAVTIHKLLGGRVARLVAGHDQAKRYLVTTDVRYRDVLSERSRTTLRLQGGLLTPEERGAFENGPEFDALVQLRRADDQAKVPGLDVPELAHWRDAVTTLTLARAR